MPISLNTSILVEALQRFRQENGRGALAELHQASGVHNLGRLASGAMAPTVETWMQLHLSAPDVVPPPTTIHGQVFKLVGEGTGINHHAGVASKRAPVKGEERLWELYAHHRSAAVVAALTTVLERIDRATTKAAEQRRGP